MAVLDSSEKIGIYTVQNLIKANRYTETYRIVDGDDHPFFLKVFLLGNIPTKLINQETRCVKEIEYSRQLHHRNIVSHVADGRLEKESGSYQYYITDYFSGPVLADRLATGGKMSEEEAMPIFRNILVGLQYMHAQATALCHNDLTPANIVLNDAMNGEAVIIDLGHTCTPCAGIAEFDTNDLDVLYHAKETMVGIFDQQTDIFSACAILYTMLTGRAPWMIDVAPEGDYKERFKAMWQYRQTHPLQTPDGISPRSKRSSRKDSPSKPPTASRPSMTSSPSSMTRNLSKNKAVSVPRKDEARKEEAKERRTTMTCRWRSVAEAVTVSLT